jgi:hypothetical protein
MLLISLLGAAALLPFACHAGAQHPKGQQSAAGA